MLTSDTRVLNSVFKILFRGMLEAMGCPMPKLKMIFRQSEHFRMSWYIGWFTSKPLHLLNPNPVILASHMTHVVKKGKCCCSKEELAFCSALVKSLMLLLVLLLKFYASKIYFSIMTGPHRIINTSNEKVMLILNTVCSP